MDVFRHELSAFPLLAAFDQAAEEVGPANLDRLLHKYGVSRSDVSDPRAWISLDFVEALFADIEQLVGQHNGFVERAAARSLTPRYMGPIYPLIVGLGSALFVYKQLPRVIAHYNQFTAWRVDRALPGDVQITTRPKPGGRIPPFLCRYNQVALSHVPMLFSRPIAQVEHRVCTLEGASECVYEVRWQDAPARPQPRIGALLGVVIGMCLALAEGASSLVAGLLLTLMAAGGWGLGKAWALRQELGLRLRDIDTHNRELERVVQTNEQRYRDLLEAKNATEHVVEERTRELRITAQQLSQTLQQVRELDRIKTDFFSNVSHELRTPLTLVLGPLAELAEGREPAGGTQRALRVMQQNGLRLLELINQLLDLQQFDAGRVELVRVPTQLGELLRVVEGRFAAACEQRGLQLNTEIDAVEPLAVDPTWTESALTNLVANAVRFATGRVVLRVRAAAGSIALEVEDDGPGVAKEDVPRLFERFVRGNHQPGRHRGSGLGLAIARETARLHGGDVTVRSTPGRSTTFTLSFPRTLATSDATPEHGAQQAAPRHDLSATVAVAALTPEPAPRRHWPGPEPNAPLVVLAEDDPAVRDIVGCTLSALFRVHAAGDGSEALSLILELRPDVVVSDVLMPELDGYDLCRALRERADTRALPVVLLTARGAVDDLVKGFDAGADDYVSKPFHPRELLARVGVHVRVRRMVSELAHRERLVALGVLSASLAHQVRSPLTAIMAGLPVLEQRVGAALDAPSRELLHSIIEGGSRIEGLIADLLNLSRLDNQATRRFRPADTVRACVRLIEARARSAVRVQCQLDDSADVVGKPGDIGHVFLHLIDNAVRAAEPSGRVRVRTFDSEQGFVFEVGDSGPGIPSDKQDTVFAPFFTTRPAGEGTGLGLAIARQVVQQHGGVIAIGRSELGGALFTVTLPTAKPAAEPTRDVRPSSALQER